MLPLFFIACNKDSTLPPVDTAEQLTTLRSEMTPDTTWLIEFQTYLTDLRDNNTPSTSYSDEDIVYGIETLMNIKYSRYRADASTIFHNDTLTLNSPQENAYDLFAKSKAFVEDEMLHKDKVVTYLLKYYDEENGIKRYVSTIIFSGGDTVPSYPIYGCDFFDEGESYYFGAGELSPDAPNLDLDCYHYYNGMRSCGGIDSGGNMETTAITEIQSKFNEYEASNFCEELSGAELHSARFYKVGNLGLTIPWFILAQDKYYNAQCHYGSIPKIGLKGCSCLNYKMLNSLSNVLRFYIREHLPQESGKPQNVIIAMNLGTIVTPFSDGPQDKIFAIGINVVYGYVNCTYAKVLNQTVLIDDLFD